MARQTPLFTAHRRHGARWVQFGEWALPLHYGSQIAEHHAVRRGVGVFDVSHMLVLDVDGPEARALLRYALANDIDRLSAPGRALYSCLLDEPGHVLDDLIVYRTDQTRYRVIANAARADADTAWIASLRERRGLRANITARRDLAMLAVQGPSARACVWQTIPDSLPATGALGRFEATQCADLFVARTGYTGEDGFELILPEERAEPVWESLIAAGATPCGLGARDTLRLEAGMNLYGQDMDDSVGPVESGLAWTVSLSGDREFVGRKAIESGRPSRQLLGLVLADAGVLRAHQRVLTRHGDGLVTSGGYGPTLGRSIGLARVPAEVTPGETVRVQVRDRALQAYLVRPPFVRNGTVLIDPPEELR